MAGFASVVARGLLGAAEGYGNYLTNEGLQRQKRADDDALLMREQALAKFRSNLAVEQEAAQMPMKKELISHTATENRVSNALELSQRSEASAAANAAEEAAKVRAEQREFDIWKKKNSIEMSKEKALTAFRAEVETKALAARDGFKIVGNDIDGDTGTRVLYGKDAQGNLRTFDTGVIVQQKTTTDPFERVTKADAPKRQSIPGFRDGGSSAAAKSDRKTISSTEYLRLVSDAQKRANAGDPEWKGLDAAGIRKKLEDLARAKGMDLPPIQ